MEEVVNLYNCLQEVSMGYVLALMPFNAILLSNRFEGFCPLGLGLIKYAAMSKNYVELLPLLVPSSIFPPINAALAAVCYESNNGYNYLWHVLELTIPRFDPTIPILAPTWLNVDNIF